MKINLLKEGALNGLEGWPQATARGILMTTAATPLAPPDQVANDSEKPGGSETEGGNGAAQSLYALIAEQSFFKGLNAPQLRVLAESAMEMQFEQGQSIFQEGSPANRFYLILSGKVVLESELKERGMTPVQTLGPGQDLGWSWLFSPYYLHSNARALEPTRTIFFYGTRLREQCEEDHDLGYELMKRVAEVVIQRLNVVERRLRECLAPSELLTTH